MKLTAKNDMSEEMVFAQELSDDELENISGGSSLQADGSKKNVSWNQNCTGYT